MRKKSIFLSVFFTVLFCVGCITVFFGSNIKSILKIHRVLTLMDNEFYFDFDKDKLIDYALTGMVIAADDPYSGYYSEEKFGNYLNNTENGYIGVGIVVGVSENNEYLEVISTMKDSPGEAAGLESGDLIIEAGGRKIFAEDMNYLVDLLRGKDEDVGDSVSLMIKRGDEIFNISLEKDKIDKDTVKGEILEDEIGYISISGFDRKKDEYSPDTYDEFKAEVEKIKGKNIDKLIIDLRDNPGGDLEVVSKIADYILPEGIITYTEDKHGKRNTIYSDKEYLDMDMVVLVNGGSASASEVLTGAMKDYDAAYIVGTTTYGKGIVQTVYSFEDGSGISLTTSKYFTPAGICIHETGIEPTCVVEPSEDTDVDAQLEKAIEILKK